MRIITVGSIIVLLAALLGCSEGRPDPPSGGFSNPLSMGVDPFGRFLLVANGDFGLTYETSSLVVVDLDRVREELEPGEVPVLTDVFLPEASVRIGAFSGRVRVDPAGRAAFVASRQDGTIYALELDREGEQGPLTGIRCGGGPGPLQRCDSRHRLHGHLGSDPTIRLTEPFGLDLVPTPDGAASALVVGFMASGDLVLFELDGDTGLPGTTQAGYVDLEQRTRDLVVTPDGESILATRRDGADLRLVSIVHDDAWELEDQGPLPTGTVQSTGTSDVRAVAVSDTGDQVFVARRDSPAFTGTEAQILSVLQRGLDTSGTPRLRPEAELILERRPVAMAYLPGHERAPDEPGLPDLLFVLCYDSGMLGVFAVHPVIQVIKWIEVGQSAYEVALAPKGMAGGAGPGLAFVSHVQTDRITILDIDPDSPTEFEIVGHIRGK